MKILVAVKRVVDHSVRVRPKPDGSGMDTASAKMSINPFCEIALEEALRVKERGLASEVVVVSLGGLAVQEQLRTGLAMGADRAIHIHSDLLYPEPLFVAQCLQRIVVREQPDLVLLGKQGIDGDHNQIGQMLAGLCNWPQATFAFKVELQADKVLVVRELDEGLETLELPLPAVVTADLRLNQPRYPTMPNIIKARQKPLEQFSLNDLGLSPSPQLQVLAIEKTPARAAGVLLDSVEELVSRLRREVNLQ